MYGACGAVGQRYKSKAGIDGSFCSFALNNDRVTEASESRNALKTLQSSYPIRINSYLSDSTCLLTTTCTTTPHPLRSYPARPDAEGYVQKR